MDRAGEKAAGGGGERIAYVDAARGLAILCVVLGHLYPGDGIVQYISSFHVPVFFILSGLLMAARDGWKTRRLTEFAAKKAKRLLYPYATISALNLALIFARRGQKAMLRQLTATLLGEGIDALWFLSALFLAEVAFKIVMSFKRRGLRIAAFLCMAVGTAGFSYLGLGAVQREGLAQLLSSGQRRQPRAGRLHPDRHGLRLWPRPGARSALAGGAVWADGRRVRAESGAVPV